MYHFLFDSNFPKEQIPTGEALQEEYRRAREIFCFSIVNRGQLWHDTLSFDQKRELAEWYHAWLNVTQTKQVPATPSWIDGKINSQQSSNIQNKPNSWL